MLFLLLSIVSISAGAKTLDLPTALDTARAQSPEIQKAASVKEEATWRRVEATSGFLPRVQASGSYLMDYKYMFTDINFGGNPVSFPNIAPTTIYTLQGQWNLWDGLASTNRLRAARRLSEAADDQYRWTEFKTNRTVALEYYRTLASKELAQVAENNLKTLQDHLREVRLFRKGGLSTNFDVLRVEVQVSEAESEILNTRDNLAIAQGHLAEVLGQDEPVEPTGKLPEMKPELANGASAHDLKGRADLEALGEQAQALDFSARAASSHWLPRVGAFGVYQYYNNRNDELQDYKNFRTAYQLGFNLTWDLFDGFADIAKHHQAVEQRNQTEKNLRIAQLKGKLDGERWERKFKYFCSVYKARQSDVVKSQESVRLAKEGRKVGARTNTDLLDAEAELFRAEAGAVTAQLGAIEALINLELSTGQALYKFGDSL